MTALLALASALLVGGADYLGGVTSRRAPAVRVAALAQAVGLLIAVPAALLVPWEDVRPADTAWAAASGVAVGTGLAVFYTAMARGLISVVAPVTAVTGALVPVAYALGRGERPGAVALAGIALAVLAIALVSVTPGAARDASRGLGLSIGAGLLFGLFYVFLSLPDEDAGLWPVPVSRTASALALTGLALATSGGISLPRSVRPTIVAIGALEVVAAVTLLLALQRGPVSVASVLASLYPVTTTFLAAVALRERLDRWQRAGVALALVAVVLVSAG